MDLKKYIEDNGIIKSWFASKMGIHRAYLSDILAIKRPIPIKYWPAILMITKGNVTYEDLVEMNGIYEASFEREKKIRESRKTKNNSQLPNR